MSQETLEHIAFRVRAATAVGALGGTLIGLYRGHHSLLRTAGLTSISWALVSTACFSSERLVNHFIMQEPIPSLEGLLVSHAIGGALSGSFLGALFGGRPIRGALFFTPAMMAIALVENSFVERMKIKKENDRLALEEES